MCGECIIGRGCRAKRAAGLSKPTALLRGVWTRLESGSRPGDGLRLGLVGTRSGLVPSSQVQSLIGGPGEEKISDQMVNVCGFEVFALMAGLGQMI